MSKKKTQRRSLLWRMFRLRYVPVWLLLLLGSVYLVWPERVHNIVTVQGQFLGSDQSAPPRYKIVWQDAYEVETYAAGLGVDDIHPQLAEDGSALWFTRRSPDGLSDIYRAEVIDGVVQTPEPVEELNSPTIEVGPVFRSDGQRLYFYSDRPGGYGGFDIYVSKKTDDGWSEPQNLGLQINSPAHEYSPAVSKSGTRLYFSSNKTPEMRRRAAEGESKQPSDQWSTTMRSEAGLRQLDLYVARRETPEEPWGPAEPLQDLNKSTSNEGDPFLGTKGAFLYFASDRTVRSGEEPNYDVYRARIYDDRIVDAENLGSGVNTPANELEPALSPEGFRLYFSRNQPTDVAEGIAEGTDDRYGVYCSEAVEIIEETGWGDNRLAAVLAFLVRNWWWVVLSLLTLLLLAALIWYLREVSLRRLPIPGFVLTALLVHIFLGLGSFYVYFGEAIASNIRRELARIVVQIPVDQELHQSHEQGQQAYEKVADLKSLESVDLTELTRRVTELPKVPVQTETPLPSVPARLRRSLPPDRFIAAPPKADIETEDPDIQRRQRELERLMEQRVELEQPEAVQEKAEQELARVDVQFDRRQPITEIENTPRLTRRTVDPDLLIQSETIADERAQTQPVATELDQQLDIERTARMTELTTATEVAAEALSAPVTSPQAPTQPQQVAISVDRQQLSPSAAAAMPSLPRRSLNPAMQLARVEVTAQRSTSAEPITTNTNQEPTPLERSVRISGAPAEATADAQVQTEALSTPVSATSGPSRPTEVTVNVDRRQTGAPAMTAMASLPRRSLNPTMQLARVEVTAQRVTSTGPAVEINTDQQPTTLQRNSRTADPTADASAASQIHAEALQTPVTSAVSGGASVSPARIDVQVGRRSTASPSPQIAALKLVGPDRTVGALTAEQPVRATAQASPIATPTSARVTAQLTRSSRVAAVADSVAEAAVITTEQPGAAAQPTPGPASVAGIDVAVDRTEGQMFEVDIKTPSTFGGEFLARSRQLVVGVLDKETVDAPPTFSQLASRLPRREARAPMVLYAEDNIGLQAMFRMRSGESKIDLVRAFRGDDRTLEAVGRGLQWLKRHQHADGLWSLEKFYNEADGKSYPGRGSVRSDTAATAFGLLPFLGDGHTHTTGDYQSTVRKGIEWLVEHQKPDGDLATETGNNVHMYSHAIAAIALCEAYGMSKDPELRDPAQRAIDFIVKAQHASSGGWRYHPNESADTSVVGWQVMALKSAQMASLNVPQSCLDLVPKWLQSAENGTGRYRYQSGGSPTPAMTAEGLLCVQYLGAERNDPRLQEGTKYLLENLPQDGKENSYYWYYGTQVMFHMQGEHWQRWNEAINEMLIDTQVTEGDLTGTWDPKDQYDKQAGRIYSTALRLLMLEVYYRHLPLYTLDGRQ